MVVKGAMLAMCLALPAAIRAVHPRLDPFASSRKSAAPVLVDIGEDCRDLKKLRDYLASEANEGLAQIFTVHNNEPTLLSDWIQYHGRLFGLSNLHVIDDNSNPGEWAPSAASVHSVLDPYNA
jgi:hypothetical protein